MILQSNSINFFTWPIQTSDDHFPHVDMTVPSGEGNENIKMWRDWLQENATGAFQVQLLSADTIIRKNYFRMFFVNERDAVLFKVFFG
jgi:hypothetical protein